MKTNPLRGGRVTPEVVSELADAIGLPLDADRAASLAAAVQATLQFTGELDELELDDVVPATVFALPEE